jgi:hypothetical protein
MRLINLALVSETDKVPKPAVDAVAAAIQTQVLRDVGPAWGVVATVDAFDSLDVVPATYWPMLVRDDAGEGAAGIHRDDDGQPYALINCSNRWTLTASHEAIEMIVDSSGNRTWAAPSVQAGQGQVEYVVEICDPCETVACSYLVNGVVVSDFCFPSYFDPMPSSRVRYSFTDSITKPLSVAKGGYLSWRHPATNHWWQQRWFGTDPVIVDLGEFGADHAESRSPVRTWLDSQARTQREESVTGVAPGTADHDALVAAYAIASQDEEGRRFRKKRLHQQIG